ncbi:hypothetical protein FGO68_gene16619 [Halteria grandinella]|uniref:Uncharacterized protein n=1 Tax=Halteria grandinella TaxID=5974 RepID=A0A8J8NTP2_HALGN|nr:hypothetical protein FGO68_gene16619 [Halteria grandinella]
MPPCRSFMIPQPQMQNIRTPVKMSMMLLRRMFEVFFLRTEPDSSRANPTCIIITHSVAVISQTVFIDYFASYIKFKTSSQLKYCSTSCISSLGWRVKYFKYIFQEQWASC